jgi:uncharacterized membrane protein (UPF0136 family)
MRGLRVALLLSSAVSISTVFGVADRVVQGHSAAGWYLANVAGVWLAVAFVFGAVARSRHEAWIAGLFAEMSALGGYYGWMRLAQHQWQPLDHPVFWSCCGLVAGPLFGLIGYLWRRQRSEIAGATLGIAFVFEAFALALAQERPRSVVVLETIAGLALAAVLLAGARWRKKHPPTA